MKCAYEAANGVEARMVANLLDQVGIAARIDGEHLAGGVGELPAAGLVRVMVEEHRYDRAREVIRDWEKSTQPSNDATAPTRSYGVLWFVLGVGAAVAIMAALNRPSATTDAVPIDSRPGVVRAEMQGQIKVVDLDLDVDGQVDRRERYFGDVLSTVTMFAPSGQVVKLEYYQRGVLSHAEFDSTGDGVMDTRYRYDRYGEIVETVRQ